MKTKIIAGFPGVGKTYFTTFIGNASDSDSSKFDKSEFPQNYINHIKSKIGEIPIIFVSSHKEVREALVENNIDFTLVYPDKSLRDDYMQRYIDRGSPIKLMDLIYDNWHNWISELQEQEGCEHIVLTDDQYLADVIVHN